MNFHKAVQLNPRYASAWVLLGHEYLEEKNTPKAIQAYRTALNIDPYEYRAWYKLGYTYETLQMYPYSLYYYRKACEIRPNDERLSEALNKLVSHLS